MGAEENPTEQFNVSLTNNCRRVFRQEEAVNSKIGDSVGVLMFNIGVVRASTLAKNSDRISFGQHKG